MFVFFATFANSKPRFKSSQSSLSILQDDRFSVFVFVLFRFILSTFASFRFVSFRLVLFGFVCFVLFGLVWICFKARLDLSMTWHRSRKSKRVPLRLTGVCPASAVCQM